MARVARKKSKSGVYHVILRGINKQTVFYDDEDREVFLNRIKLAKDKMDFELYAFCFMSNHIHLLMRERESKLGAIMRKTLSSYVFWYNSKYERVGNLFQDRFTSEPVEDDTYLLCAVRYIHQNPMQAGMVTKPAEYEWSSYSAYLGNKKSIIDKKLVLDILQGEEQYKTFMEEYEDIKFKEPTERFKISDDKLHKEIKRLLKINDVTEIYKLNREQRNESIKQILLIKGSNPYQVSRVTGVPMGVIRAIIV